MPTPAVPPAIDVLLPVLRALDTLPDAVGDVLAQRDVDVRLIAIVDTAPAEGPDGEDDGSRAWLLARAAEQPRLLVIDGPGAGAGAALHAGLAAADAPWLSHMEADDRCPAHRLATLHAALQSAPAGAPAWSGVTSAVEQVGAVTDGMARYLAWQNGLRTHAAMAAERFVEIPALHQTGLYRTEVLRAIGGYATRGPWPPDIDFWFRWFEHGARVVKLPEVLYQWRQHDGQSTRGGGQHGLEALRAAKVDALERLHGRTGRQPREVLLLSVGATLEAWRRDLETSTVTLADAVEWRPGTTLPPTLAACIEPTPPPSSGAAGVERATPLVLAAYGSAAVRQRVRGALGLREPDALLFTA